MIAHLPHQAADPGHNAAGAVNSQLAPLWQSGGKTGLLLGTGGVVLLSLVMLLLGVLTFRRIEPKLPRYLD